VAVLQSEVIPKNSGRAYIVKKGQRLRIAGKSIVDFVAFNLDDLTERFDQARTKTNQVKIFITTGDTLFSKRNNPMLTVVEERSPKGVTIFKKACAAASASKWWLKGKRNECLPKVSISILNRPNKSRTMAVLKT
jgi:uncharacterized protein YcgI (DUF1989 family)